jgi:nitric oxide reductase NorD protein
MRAPWQALLERLTLADPETAACMAAGLHRLADTDPWPEALQRLAAEDIIWALAQETAFGKALAEGYVHLAPRPESLQRYHLEVRGAGAHGPSMGRLIARHLPPVLATGDPDLTKRFFHALSVVRGKGAHLLGSLLQCESDLLSKGDIRSAEAFLELLQKVFAAELTYNRARALAHLLATAVPKLPEEKRGLLIGEIARAASVSTDLVDILFDGFEKGLTLLEPVDLTGFVTAGLDRYARNRRLGEAYLGLDSQLSRQTLERLQVCVPLSQVRQRLTAYLRARVGGKMAVRPLSALSPAALAAEEAPMVLSDGRFLYLPDQLQVYSTQAENISLYKLLTRLEAGLQEFGTFNLDLEKLGGVGPGPPPSAGPMTSDLERFFLGFSNPGLALDLFTLLETERHRILMEKRYPGLLRRALPMLKAEIDQVCRTFPTVAKALLMHILLGQEPADLPSDAGHGAGKLMLLVQESTSRIRQTPEVETSAREVSALFPALSRLLPVLPLPFGRRVRPDLVRATHQEVERLARRIKEGLEKAGLHAYLSDLREHLIQNPTLTPDTLKPLVTPLPHEADASSGTAGQDVLEAVLSRCYDPRVSLPPPGEKSGSIHRYPEWDFRLEDYHNDHVRLVERVMAGGEDNAYPEILARRLALVERIRYAFELLKPEGLSVLRHWTEGDEFDYRALIEAAIDRKMRRIPSERLYIKRLKRERDVAVMLLVDLSRSTANTVSGTRKTVLEVEREAIVLFCEALQVVGDCFAIAGFSGTGPLGVDYWTVKDFDEPMGETVRGRIGAMRPQRNTRTGAAIRHAIFRLSQLPHKIRLLIPIGDGFPNDTGYKGEHAAADARKAGAEARARGIFMRPITVNAVREEGIEALYGPLQHHIISDVNELPDKLWRIYSAMTR